jgi:UDP-glucose 4-epimerase
MGEHRGVEDAQREGDEHARPNCRRYGTRGERECDSHPEDRKANVPHAARRARDEGQRKRNEVRAVHVVGIATDAFGARSSMRIIVTGGAGFIGSHIVDAYLAAGHEVVVLDSLWAQGGGRRENVPSGVSFLHIDIRDPGIERVFRDFAPEVVNHHAAQHSVAISVRDPQLDAHVNVLGLLNVLENSVRAGVKKVIFASSGATYGEPERLPVDETTPQNPDSPYGITKMVAERYLRFYRREHGLDFTSLRYGNVYGPRQDASGEAGVVAIFLNRFIAEQGVKIFWDGEQTRDYVYVEDIADLNVMALERGGGGCYAIGTNIRTSVNEIYRAIAEISGFEAPIERLPKRPGDVRDAQIDASLAHLDLGWAPATTLRDGMRKTYEFFRERQPA